MTKVLILNYLNKALIYKYIHYIRYTIIMKTHQLFKKYRKSYFDLYWRKLMNIMNKTDSCCLMNLIHEFFPCKEVKHNTSISRNADGESISLLRIRGAGIRIVCRIMWGGLLIFLNSERLPVTPRVSDLNSSSDF